MNPVWLIWVIIAILVIVFFGRIMSVALKVAFYLLMLFLVLVLLFNISYQQMAAWVSNILMLVF